MNYIVFDLEWNQSPDGKFNSNAQIPFEIIQIGAVKLDSELNETSQFERYIRPAVYKKIHKKVQEILNVSIDELNKKGVSFTCAIKEFLDWCGEDYIFCSWGSMDLTELQRNMKFYKIKYDFPKPFLFYDLQKLYSICFQDGKMRSTLQHAIEELNIEQEEDYHTASCDARYTSKVFRKIDFDKAGTYYSVDTYIIPDSRKNEYHLDFGQYEKYISRGFSTREAAASDREVRSCKCFKCGRSMKRIVKWFSTNNKNYYALFMCEEHGWIKGRFKIKTTDDNRNYSVRILKITDENGAEKIKIKQKKEKEHRRQLRLKAMEKADTIEKKDLT